MSKTKVHVLLIDDDNIYQFVACKTLESTGFADRIQVCSNGEEAYNFLKKNANNIDELPDIILLDINMPVMNGWEFLELYQPFKATLPKDIPVFMVTSSMNDQDREFAKRFSCVQDYVVKPLAKEKIKALLATAVYS